MDYYATLIMRNTETITEIPVLKNLNTNGIFDLIFNTSQTLNINLIELKDDQTQQKFKCFKDTQHLKLLPDRESDYPTTKMSSWCTYEQDMLYGYFPDIPKLLKYGFKIKANIVQANKLLFDPLSSINCPAEVIFDLENRLYWEHLQGLACTEEDHSPPEIKKPYLIRVVNFSRQHIGLSFICFLLFIVIILR